MADPQDHELLNRARLNVGLSVETLWMRYFELGGAASAMELDAYLQGALVPRRLERDILAHAINEAAREKGEGDVVSYHFSD